MPATTSFISTVCLHQISVSESRNGPSDSTMSEDAGIEPRTVATSTLAVRRSLTTEPLG